MKPMSLIVIYLSIISHFYFQVATAAMKVSKNKVSISGKENAANVKDLRNWSDSESATTVALCSEVFEIPDSYICSFKTKIFSQMLLIKLIPPLKIQNMRS